MVALSIGNKTIKEAGVNPLSKQEKDLILRNGYSKEDVENIAELLKMPSKKIH